MQTMILALVFVGTLALPIGTFVFLNRRRLAGAAAARARVMGAFAAPAPNPVSVATILKDDWVSEVAFLNRWLGGRFYTERLAAELARAEWRRGPGEFVLGSAASAALLLSAGVQLVGVPLGFAFGGFGAAVPYLLLKRQQRARLDKFERQLPGALDMLVNALSAGYSLPAAMEFVGAETPAPLGPEFSRVYEEQRLGMDVRAALLAMQERIGTADVRIFVTSLLIQRETGGNLTEVLEGLAAMVRERVAFRGTVAALTAEPRMSARVLALLPVAIFALLWTSNPEFLQPLVTTPMGRLMLAYAAGSVLVGYTVMMQIANVDL